MKLLRNISITILIFFVAVLSIAEGLGDQTPLLVETQLLEENLSQNRLLIIDIGRSREEYDSGHIPGAVYLELDTVFGTVNGVSGMLPPVESVIPRLEAAGIDSNSIVVIYDASRGLWATRLFWALEFFGHKNVHVLNGGYPLWEEQGRAVSTTVPSVRAGNFEYELQWDKIEDTDYILTNLENEEVQLIDARSIGEYKGTDVRAARGGHIPNAININWILNLDEQGAFLTRRELAEMYDSADISKEKTQVIYCQTGVRAAHDYFVLRYLGYEDVRLYDGSWVVWGDNPDTPIGK